MNETKDTITPETEENAAPLKLDVRVTPIAPKDSLIGFANVTIADSLVIEGLKVCSGEKGIYVNMPSVQGKDGQWRDIVKPITAEARAQITEAAAEAYGAAIEKMQATVEAARSAALPAESREDAGRDGAAAKEPVRDAAAKDGPAKPSTLGALKDGAEKSKEQPVKAPSGKGDKAL